ncbi:MULTISPECIES: hypothetical protein [unclassified Haloferax]|uniref:DUF7856 family protein n=1 Tax=unclassified Haloferax TaxID=2625095 RepID=UPI002875EA7C|nr:MULTISPECIES: hypothetical protein [unclassified Haloferax]MDS0242681.1 hypothetical protein [Haloferax sp. S2CR25]MDS0445802.1 hypothetical protein [Haloferax sp. S2CR25-2]
MRLRLPHGSVYEGSAIDLAGESVDIDADAVVAAVRSDGGTDATGPLRIDCPSPGPGHDRLGRVPVSASSPSRGWLLAAVGRSRGRRSPVADDLARLEARLAEHRDRAAEESEADERDRVGTSAAALRDARRRVAAAGEDESRLRERVAALRGRVNAHRDAGDDEAAAAARQELVETATELSEVETERVAAEQRLSALEHAVRAERDGREVRLKLEDAVENRRREARAHFAAELGEAFEAALRDLASLPATATPAVDSPSGPAALESDPVARALAAVRLADLSAPVVLSCGRFSDAEAAADWLGVPVVRC